MSWTSGPIGVGLLRFEFDFNDSRSKSERARTPENNFKQKHSPAKSPLGPNLRTIKVNFEKKSNLKFKVVNY